VQLHTDARYQSHPTPLKVVLLIAHGLALTALLVLAWRWWRGGGAGLIRPHPSWADAVVVAVSLAWVVIGPLNIDDSWYLLMARNAMESGYIGNVIYQFNVTESPFVASQYLMQAWGALGHNWSLAWLRLVPLAYGLASYALLRVLVTTILGRVARAPWAVAAAHLLWWLPYGMTLRPEPLIALGTAATFVLSELARRRRSVGVFATATALAALTVTASPTGLVAAAPLLLGLPWLWQWWQERRSAADWHSRFAALLLMGAASSIVIPVAFADATLGDVLESVAVHRWYYRQNAWYEEYQHYANLLVGDERGAWGKRVPVLLTLAVLLAVALGAGRRAGTGGPSGRLLGTAAAVTALSLIILALTPTKWVNHFGAITALGTVLLAAAVIRSPLPRRIGAAAVAIGTGGLVAAASVAFAGPNLWRPLSDWGQPFGNHLLYETPYEQRLLAPAVGPLALRNPLLWLAVAAAGWWWLRRKGHRGRSGPDRAVLIAGTGLGVTLMLVVFTIAPLRRYPGTSVALMNLRALTGAPCGLATAVQVLTDVTPGLGPPAGTATLTGDMRATPLPDPATAGARITVGARITDGAGWDDDVVGGAGIGSLTTPWYPLPGVYPADVWIVVPLRGTLTGQQRLTMQVMGTSNEVRTVTLPAIGKKPDWAQATVALRDFGLTAPQAVRVVVEDRVAGPDSWLAAGPPRLAAPRSVAALIADRPVFADQVSAGLWPCQHQIAIRDGLAQPPALRLRAGDGLEDSITTISVFADNGGTLRQADRLSKLVELPTRLTPPGMPTLGWGHVEELVYAHPVGLVDLQVTTVRRAGWARLPTLIGERYTGRAYIG
jgi:arabinosyltransferase B/arabinosyltransferase C